MKLTTYLNFPGNCADAFRYYEKTLGGKIDLIMTFGQSPMPHDEGADWNDKVMHAKLTIGDSELMGADDAKATPIHSAYLSVAVDSDAEAERVYKALSEGGETQMPLQETFFATKFGQCRDKFGVSWMVLNPKPMPVTA